MKNNDIKKDIAILYFAHFLSIFLGALTLKVILMASTQTDFSNFLIIKRFSVLFAPIITLNLGVALAHFISEKKNFAFKFFLQSLIIISIIIFFVFVIFLIFKPIVSNLLFGDINLSYYVLPTLLFTISYCAHLLFSGYYRGLQNFYYLNFLQILYWLISFLVSYLLYFFYEGDMYTLTFIFYFSILYLVLSSILFFVFKSRIYKSDDNLVADWNSQLFIYGGTRMFNGVFVATLFFIPLILSVQGGLPTPTIANIGVLIVLVKTLQSSVSPLNVLFLPYFSNIKTDENFKKMNRNLEYILDIIMTFPVFISISLYFFSYDIIFIWFGSDYVDINVTFQSLIIPTAFYLIYIVISGVLNGIYKFPYVTLISFLSLMVMVISSIINFEHISFLTIISSLSFSLYVLGAGALLLFYILFYNNVNFLNTKNLRTIIIMFLYIFTVFYIFNFIGTVVLDFTRFIHITSKFQLYIISFIVKLTIWIFFSLLALHLLKLNKHLWVEKIFQFIFRK
tara:strand:- start:448 stop:1974 length:1527 start_codon:yes stop_codon:yes gene_type:complete